MVFTPLFTMSFFLPPLLQQPKVTVIKSCVGFFLWNRMWYWRVWRCCAFNYFNLYLVYINQAELILNHLNCFIDFFIFWITTLCWPKCVLCVLNYITRLSTWLCLKDFGQSHIVMINGQQQHNLLKIGQIPGLSYSDYSSLLLPVSLASSLSCRFLSVPSYTIGWSQIQKSFKQDWSWFDHKSSAIRPNYYWWSKTQKVYRL